MKHSAFTQIDDLATLALRIGTDGPRAALGCNLSDREQRQWAYTARFYLDVDGDDDNDFAGMVDEFYAEPEGYGLPDEDSDWRHSRAAETFFGARYAA